MIRPLAPGDEGPFLELLEKTPLYGQRIRTLYECYERFPALCGFYVFEGGALSITGAAALIAGRSKEEEELASFLRFSGVKEAEGAALRLPGFQCEPFCIMESMRPAGSLEKADIRKASSPLPILALLREAGMQMDEEGFYADFCLRRNRGIACAYLLYESGRPVATAGVYSAGPKEGCLSCVATAPPYRKKGYAAALCAFAAADQRLLGRRTLLTCRPPLASVYERAGFAVIGTACRAVLEGENK